MDNLLNIPIEQLYEPTNIEYIPICATCGHRIMGDVIYYENGDRLLGGRVEPCRCPECGKAFSGIIVHTPKVDIKEITPYEH